MSILHRTRPADQIDTLDYSPAYAPTAEDLEEYARWLVETEAVCHADEPTPAEVLDGQAPADPDEPRYRILCNMPGATDGGYSVLDRLTGRTLGFRRWLTEAMDLVEELEEADEAEAMDLGRWWATLPESPDLDARWTTLDAVIDAEAEQAEAQARMESMGYL